MTQFRAPPITGYQAGDMGHRSRQRLEITFLTQMQGDSYGIQGSDPKSYASVSHLRLVKDDLPESNT